MDVSCVMSLKVIPSSKKISVDKSKGNIIVRLTAAPTDGKANQQLIEVLSEFVNLPKRCIRITSGQTSRVKKVCITGITSEQIESLFDKQLTWSLI